MFKRFQTLIETIIPLATWSIKHSPPRKYKKLNQNADCCLLRFTGDVNVIDNDNDVVVVSNVYIVVVRFGPKNLAIKTVYEPNNWLNHHKHLIPCPCPCPCPQRVFIFTTTIQPPCAYVYAFRYAWCRVWITNQVNDWLTDWLLHLLHYKRM